MKLIAESPTRPDGGTPTPFGLWGTVGMPCTIASFTEAQITAGKGAGAKDGR